MIIMNSEDLLKALEWRYATKVFDPAKKIPADIWQTLERALVLTPTSYGLQPYKFLIISDPAKRAELLPHSWGQKQVVDCSHFVVFAGRKGYDAKDLEHFVERTAAVRGVSKESLKGYADIIAGSVEKARQGGYLDSWLARQAYIALGLFMTSAALLGIDVCPMEGLDPAQFDAILGLPALGYTALCAGAAGYRAPDDKYAAAPKVRFRAEEVILHV